jgi:hypothetical protein
LNTFHKPPFFTASLFVSLSLSTSLLYSRRNLDLIDSHTFHPPLASSTARFHHSRQRTYGLSHVYYIPDSRPVLRRKCKESTRSQTCFTAAQKPLSNPPRQPPAPVLDSKKAGPTSPTLETSLTSLADLSLHDGPSSGANPSAPTSPSGSTSHSSTNCSDRLPSHRYCVIYLCKAVPIPNVWNQRIQQRAQTRPQPRPPQSLPHMTQSHVPRVPSPTRDPSSTSSGSRQPDVPVSASRSDPCFPICSQRRIRRIVYIQPQYRDYTFLAERTSSASSPCRRCRELARSRKESDFCWQIPAR